MSDTGETQVMPLAEMARRMTTVGPTDKTMPLRVLSELKESGAVHPDSSVTGRIPRKMNGQFAGPFPVRRVGGLSLSTSREGVEQKSSDDTATHALPAVEKMTGKPSLHAIAHRTARQIQAQYPHVMIWYGEYTKSFWVVDSSGLREFETITAMCQGMGW